MNKADIAHKFESFEEREDVKEVMRNFTFVLSQMYEKQAIGVPIAQNKAADHVLEEFEIDTTVYDKDELVAENADLKPKIKQLEKIKQDLLSQVKQLRDERLAKQ